MIRRGRTEGWLHLPTDAVKPWAEVSGVSFTVAKPAVIPGRGLCLLATRDLQGDTNDLTEILSVAEELVLSHENIAQQAKCDQDLREVLESLGEFGVVGLSIFCHHRRYVKTLPNEMLPTFWTEDEVDLLVGTTLAPAVSSKLKSLHREYELLRELTANTRWFGIVEPHLTFDDWLQVDSMFRSRALEFYGSCMVPGLDIASHASGEETNAYYERRDGTCLLYLLPGHDIRAGDEITISYGDEKGACEMLFSYGFLEDTMDTAETLFLSLSLPDTDTTRAAKMKTAGCAPGFKIIDIQNDQAQEGVDSVSLKRENELDHDAEGGRAHQMQAPSEIDWAGDYVWLLCVTEEDGLDFKIAQSIEGPEELQMTFSGQELPRGASDLRRLLSQHERWDVYRLRAIVILQQRVLDQLQVLYETQERVEATAHGDGTAVRNEPFRLAMRLRQLEFELLDKAYNAFEVEKLQLAESETVKKYLEEVNRDEGVGNEVPA